MKKRLLSLVLVLCLIVPAVFAEELFEAEDSLFTAEEIEEIFDEIVEEPIEDGEIEYLSVDDDDPILTEEETAAPVQMQAEDLMIEGIKLAKGDKFNYAPVVAQVTTAAVRFSSEDPKIAKVDPVKGIITAAAIGNTKIIAEPEGADPIALDVEVVAAVTKVTAAADRKTIGVGESVELITGVLPAADVNTKLALTSNAKKVASVTEDGIVTGLKAGTATIIVKAYNGKKASVKFVVKKAPQTLKAAVPTPVMGVGEKTQLKLTFGKGQGGGVRYSSSDEAVAIVSSTGSVKAVGTGSAVVTAETYNGVTADVEITVHAAPVTVSADVEALTLAKGDKYTLTPVLNEGEWSNTFTYESLSPKIAKVDPNSGKITAVAPGLALITMTAFNDVATIIPVTVVGAVSKVIASVDYPVIGVGQSVQVSAHTVPEDITTKITYSSSNKKIATVDANGMVTAKKKGTVTISAKAYNGKVAKVKIKVDAEPADMGTVYYEVPERIHAGEECEFIFIYEGYEDASITVNGTEVDYDGNSFKWVFEKKGEQELVVVIKHSMGTNEVVIPVDVLAPIRTLAWSIMNQDNLEVNVEYTIALEMTGFDNPVVMIDGKEADYDGKKILHTFTQPGDYDFIITIVHDDGTETIKIPVNVMGKATVIY